MTKYMQYFCDSDIYLENNDNYTECKILNDDKNEYCSKKIHTTHLPMCSRRIMLTKIANLFF